MLFTRTNNIPVYDKTRGSYRALPKHTLKGFPDIPVGKQGRFIGLEVKTKVAACLSTRWSSPGGPRNTALNITLFGQSKTCNGWESSAPKVLQMPKFRFPVTQRHRNDNR